MGDDRQRDLERQASAGDPEARAAYVRDRVRARDAQVVAARALCERLAEGLKRIEAQLPRCPPLELGALEAVTRQALLKKTGYDPAFGFGLKTLAKVWPEEFVPGSRQALGWENRVLPTTVMAFAARLDETVVLRVGLTESAKPTPGTVWHELSPWRFAAKPETLERKCRVWAAAPAQGPIGEELSLAAATLWLEIEDVQAAGEDTREPVRVDLDRPSDAQLKFVTTLREKKRVDDAAFTALLQEHGGVKRLEHLERQDASSLIEALKALKVKPKKKAARKKTAAKGSSEKIEWSGALTRVQPRIRMTVVGGEEQHGYQGYVLTIEGTVGAEARTFTVGVGKAAGQKHAFRVGDRVSGVGVPVADPTREPCELYKASKLKVTERAAPTEGEPPPWVGAPPPLEDYRARGHRRLSARAYGDECKPCLWGCWMPVDEVAMRGDPSDPRFEAMCYGPKDCFFFEEPPSSD